MEVAMAAFVVSGTGDEALAELKAHQEASEARFKAALDRIFKSPSNVPPQAPAPSAPPAPAGKAAASNRNRPSYSRLRS
jgi:hypothetical protein